METAVARIAIVNVNTSQQMTEVIEAAAQAVAAPDTIIEGVTPIKGPASVETHVEGFLSAVGVIEAVHARHFDPALPPVDGWIVAGYGEHGKEPLLEMLDVPVVDITEASAMAAMLIGDSYAVVTTLDRTVPMIRARLMTAGLLQRCASIAGTGLGVLELEADPVRTEEIIMEKARQALAQGAEVICLGCGGMAGRGVELTELLGAPVVDGVAAAVGQAEALIRQQLSPSKVGTFAPRGPKRLTGFEQLEIKP